jgi:F-type H+-transporting ATPase subunit gamma
MASLRDIRKRIRTVKSTRQITKAMKMVAAAKLRKAQDAIVCARPYAQTLGKIISEVMARSEPGSLGHPLLEQRAAKNVEVLLITSDRGLAGGFNANVIRRVQRFIKEEGAQYKSVTLSTIGRKGNDFFKTRGLLRKDNPGLLAKVKYESASDVAKELSARFTKGEVDAVYICYNEFRSAISQAVVFNRLLPFEASATGDAGGPTIDFAYEPSSQEVLNKLLPQAMAIKVYRALLESIASEHGARMTAMENATTNASDMIGKLTLFYNRTRQAVITKELMEIVSGAEALK